MLNDQELRKWAWDQAMHMQRNAGRPKVVDVRDDAQAIYDWVKNAEAVQPTAVSG